jgi:DNA repair exonuclease SbcCD ATPase subunit
VPSSCPICEQPIASTAAHCSVCGFPTALAIEGLRAVAGMEASAGDTESAVASAPGAVRSAGTAPSAEEDLTAAISRDLRSKMDMIRGLGPGPDVTAELCQAALSEAQGRVAEALDILRSAQQHLEGQTDEVLRGRLAGLTDRRGTLERTGVRFAIGSDLTQLNSAIEDGAREEAMNLLLGAERRMSQFEADWKGLQGLLSQIEGLRSEAEDLGIPLGEIRSEIEGIRDRLAEPAITEEALDSIAQEAAQTLMLLHEAIPSSLEAELALHEATLDRYPDESQTIAVARRLHLEATRHLKKGRLPEAVQSVRDLRAELMNVEKKAAAPVTAPAAPLPPVTETEAEALERLLKKARALAGRVRTLPPESETAHDAAIQIREATELLRARQLKEADQTLSRLMRMLSTEPSGIAGA